MRALGPLTDRCWLCLVAQKHAIAVAILVGEILFVIIPNVLAVRELPRDGAWWCAGARPLPSGRYPGVLLVLPHHTCIFPPSNFALPVVQIEKEKFKLFFILMHVPSTVVKHLTHAAQAGYEKMKIQVSAERTEDGGDADEHSDDEGEVCSWGR